MISIVASRTLSPTPELVAIIAGLVASATPGEPFGIRVNAQDAETSPTERLVAEIARAVGRHIIRCAPDIDKSSFKRDYWMVERSSIVVAFFQQGQEMQGGTGHVVKAALDRGIHIEAYTIDEFGEVVMIGSDSANPHRVHIGSRPDVLRDLGGIFNA